MTSNLMHKFSFSAFGAALKPGFGGPKTRRAATGRKRPGPAQRIIRTIRYHSLLSMVGAGVVLMLVADATGVFARIKVDAVAFAGRTAVEVGLVVSETRLTGVNRSEEATILEAVAIAAGDPLLEIDMGAARARVEALPWVRTASISRRLPGDVLIDVVEREPYALWQLDGHLWLIDKTGVQITDKGLHAWRALPLVVGVGAAEGAPALQALLDREPALSRRVKAAVRVSERRWDIRFANGVNLLLPADSNDYGPLAAWLRFAALERRHAILEREILSLDMRQSDRLVVRVTPEGQESLADQDRRT